jgi:hypothetical protein
MAASASASAGAGARGPHPCATGAPIDASDVPPVFFMKDFDASRITFTRPSWDNVKNDVRGGGGGGVGGGGGGVGGRGGGGGGSVGGRGVFGGRGGGRGHAAGEREEQQSVVFLGPQNSRTMYCRPTCPPFRVQLCEGVIQKVSLPGGDDSADGAAIPDTASDAELLRHYAGKRLNVKIRFDGLEPDASDDGASAAERARERAEFVSFWTGWQEAAVRPFVQSHDAMYPDAPLVPPIMRQHLSAEAYDQSLYESARQIFQKKSPLFFQKDTSNSYTVRVRVQVQRNFDTKNYAFNECTLFANRGETDENGALKLMMCDASVLRRGARITAVVCSGGMYMNGNAEFGHHVQMMQAVVKPYSPTTMAPMPRLSVHLPGVSAINILIPTEAPPLLDDEETAAPKKRGRREDDFAAFYDDAGGASAAGGDVPSFA